MNGRLLAPFLTFLSGSPYNPSTSLLQHTDSPNKMAEFTHFNESGRARMVDVSAKASTERIATAQAKILLLPATLEKIQQRTIAKGDVLHPDDLRGMIGDWGSLEEALEESFPASDPPATW